MHAYCLRKIFHWHVYCLYILQVSMLVYDYCGHFLVFTICPAVSKKSAADFTEGYFNFFM